MTGERVCPRCGKSSGLAWVRKWDVEKSHLGPPMHVGCAMEEISGELREQEKALN
jgi:hypothetical protein